MIGRMTSIKSLLEKSRGRRWLKLAIFEFILLSLLAALLEVSVRILIPQTLTHDAPELWMPDEVIGWRHRPNARVSINTGDRDVDVCIDEEGDRISCIAERSHDCRRRVLVVGDSYSEAVAVPFEQTVWHLLEEETGACIEVAAVGAYSPSQYRKLVEERLSASGGRFDLILLNLYVGNDFTPNVGRIPPAQEVQRKPIRLLPEGLGKKQLRAWFYPFNQLLESRSHAYVAIRTAVRRILARGTNIGIWGFPDVLRPSWLTEEAIEPAISQVRLIAESAIEEEIPVLISLIPMSVQVLDPGGAGTLEAFPGYRDDFDPDLSTERIVPRLEEIPGIQLFDLLPGLRQRASRAHWGRLDAHFSPEGHQLWFELIREEVRTLLDGNDPD
jgi:hypothetical protein